MACIQSSGFLHAQRLVDVRVSVRENLMSKPGSVIALGVKVTNLSRRPSLYRPKVSLPSGWRMVTRDYPFVLQSGASDVRLISFAVPMEARSKQYDIAYSVTDSAGNEGRITLPIIVLPVIQLELELLDAPRFVVAGATFSTTFILTNNGNAATGIRLRYRSSNNFPITIDSVVRNLGPRENRPLVLSVKTEARSGKVSHTLELEAISARDSTVRVRTSSVVQVVPSATRAEEDYFEYPVTLRLREVGQDRLFATQVEALGSGSLSERRLDRLEILFRGPETQTKSVLGQRDEYHVSYRTNNYEVYAGDLNYTLSTLTEFGRYATGTGGRVDIGRLDAGGFYNWNRWSTQAQHEAAGFVNYDVSKMATIGLNFLEKQDQSVSDIATVRSLFTPFKNSTADLEYASGTKDGNRDDAFSARLNGSQNWIAYDMRYVKAGPKFGGYYQDIDFLSASVNLQALSNVRIETYGRLENRNLARDTNQIYAPSDRYFQVGAAYSDVFALYLLRNTHEDEFPNPKYSREEDAMQGRLGYSFRSASIYLYGDYGSTRDKTVDASFPYRRLALNTSFRPVANQNYSASVEYSNGQDVYTSQNQERLSASLNVWMLLGQATQIQLNGYSSRMIVSPSQTYTLFEASLEHVFPFNHKILLRARESIIATAITTNELAYALEYSIPLGIPLKRITAVGQLRGTVRDERGRGIAGVLVNAGDDAALTNRTGQYFFAATKPGSVFVSIDKASIGLDRTTTQPAPFEVIVRGGETATLDIGVTRSVLISGTLELYGNLEPAFGDTTISVVDLGGKSGIFLELTNGKDINRRVTDNHGKFIFADIRPGNWTLNVIGGDVPEYHVVTPESIDLDLKPGSKQDIAIQLKPKKRTIKILQQGTITPQLPTNPENKVQTESPCIVAFDANRNEFVLQLSSWVTRAKAARAARKAEQLSGKKSFTTTTRVPKIGFRYRVFLGGFATKEAAEETCVKLKANE